MAKNQMNILNQSQTIPEANFCIFPMLRLPGPRPFELDTHLKEAEALCMESGN